MDPNPQAPPPAIGQTPILESDKRRLAFRTEADSANQRERLFCGYHENARFNRYRDVGIRGICCERSRSIDRVAAARTDAAPGVPLFPFRVLLTEFVNDHQ